MNRADIRIKIREILRDFYDIDNIGPGGIAIGVATLPVLNVSRYNIGDILIVADEHMQVSAIDTANDQLTVIRGVHLTTQADHVSTWEIKINPEFTNRALNQCIDFSIGDTFDRQAGIWIETIDETLTTSTDAGVTGREYTIPGGLTDIARIQVEDDNGHYQENRDWELVGSKIQFKKDFSDAGKGIRLIGTSYQALLTDDATALTLGDEQAQFVIYDATWYAIQMRFGHRLKATEYSAAVNDRAGQPFDLINMANTLKRTVADLRLREFKPRMPYYMTRPRR